MSYRFGSAWMLVASLFFSLMGVCVKFLGEHYSFYELTFYRTIFAVVVLGIMIASRQQSLKTPYLLLHIGRGFAGTMGILCLFYGIIHLPLATATTLNYTSPLFLALLSVVIYKEKLNLSMGVSLILGFIGVIILLSPTLEDGQFFHAVIATLSGAFGGWAYVQVKDLTNKGEPEWRIVFYFSLVSTVIAFVLTFIEGWHSIVLKDVPFLFGVGVCALIAQMSMTRAYKVGRKFTVASLSYLTVVFATIFGALWFNNILTIQEGIGMVIIMASGLLGSVLKR